MRDVTIRLHKILTAAAWLGGVWLFFRYLLSPLLPFLLALGLSALLEPWVQRLRKAARLRRSFAAVVLTTLVLLTVGGAAVLLFIRLGKELTEWSAHLPDAIAAFPNLWNNALSRLEGWYLSCPPYLRSVLDLTADAIGNNAASFAGKAGTFLMERISSAASRLPGISLFFITTILALYFTSVSYGSILAFLKRQLPPHWQKRCRAAVHCCRTTMLTWLRSELLLLSATFLILLCGFGWMRLPYTLLAAFSVTLIDALPVLGTGTVLLPWAFFQFLLGNTRQGISLAALYVAVFLTRSLLEPKLLAGRADLPPLAVLFGMYLGYCLMGVGGMILLPIFILLLKQLHNAEVIRIWR